MKTTKKKPTRKTIPKYITMYRYPYEKQIITSRSFKTKNAAIKHATEQKARGCQDVIIGSITDIFQIKISHKLIKI